MAIHNAADNSFKLITRLQEDYVERLRLQIPSDMNKMLVDIILNLMNKSGYDRNESEAAVAIVEKAEDKEYGGMFEAVIESMIEERTEGREEGFEYVLELIDKGLSAEEIREHIINKQQNHRSL